MSTYCICCKVKTESVEDTINYAITSAGRVCEKSICVKCNRWKSKFISRNLVDIEEFSEDEK